MVTGIAVHKRLSLMCSSDIRAASSTAQHLPYEVDTIGAGYQQQPPPRPGAAT